MDGTKNINNNNKNNQGNNERPFKTGWFIWIYLIVFYTYSFFAYNNEQKLEEEKAKEEANKVIDYETTEFNLSLKEIVNNQEVWKTYTVNVIDGREYNGIYWLDNSKTEGYVIKLIFEDDGSVQIEEWTQDKTKVRHLARLMDGSINIKTYNKIEVTDEKETKKTVETKETQD